MSLKIELFRTMLLGMKRGLKNGKLSNAKPIFFLSIIEAIEKGQIIGNKFGYEAFLKESYEILCQEYEPGIKVTPFFKPFYHFASDGCYHIKWKINEMPEHTWHTPSSKFLKDNMKYAYLDPELWDLLQDPASREELKNSIVQYFFR